MLFQRIYNWIKYKSLPASFLFKNRLFLERNSKHKKIFSNFGAHFKNSKWTHFSTTAIKFQFKNKYKTFLLKTFIYLFIFLIFFFYNNFYLQLPIINNLIFFIWTIVDAIQYYISFLFWTMFILFVKICKFSQNLFSFNNFSNKTFIKKTDTQPLAFLSTNKTYDQKFVFKEDLNFFTNLWINNKFLKNTLKNNHQLFNYFKNTDKTLINNFWIINTYKLFNQLNNGTENFNSFWLNRNFEKILKNSQASIFIYKNFEYNAQILKCLIFLNNQETYFEKKIKMASSTVLFNNRTSWNITSITSSNNDIKKNKLNLFWFKNFNQKNYLTLLINNSEFQSILTDLNNYLSSIKTQRWLYRYYPIHRKSLKFVNKIAQGAKSHSLYLLNHNNTNNYLWTISEPTSLKLPFQMFNINFKLDENLKKNTYKNLLNNAWTQKNINQNYLTSYLWTLKKNYFFNSILNNNTTTGFKNNLNEKLNNSEIFLNDLTFISNALNKFSALSLNHYSFCQSYKPYDLNVEHTPTFIKKDIQIFFKNLTILNFDLLNAIVEQQINSYLINFNFINYYAIPSNQTFKNLNFNNNFQNQQSIIFYTFNLLKINTFFFSDLKETLTNY